MNEATANNKYYFRKKSRDVNSEGYSLSSSTDGEEISTKPNDARKISLHIITDPGQSASVNCSFQELIQRLDPTLDVICVSERLTPLKEKHSKASTNIPIVPAVAIVLFFRDEYKIDKLRFSSQNNDSEGDSHNNEAGEPELQRAPAFPNVSQFFTQKHWRFHHRVAVSGKLISCETNQQDYYEYIPNELNSAANGRKTPNRDKTFQTLFSPCASLPLWGVRKVHYGKQVLRFTLFTSQENWNNQISLYKLILRKEETKIRDDFCYFETSPNKDTAVQLGLKRLPMNLKPQPLSSSILQFKITNVGQLVPLLPHVCDPISELRWRTRDHDSNLILFQIYRSRDSTTGSSFVKKVFGKTESPGNSNKKQPVPVSPKNVVFSEKADIKKKSDIDSHKSKSKRCEETKLPLDILDCNKETSNGLEDSFMCIPLPEKMPLLKPTIYFQSTDDFSSSSSTTSSSCIYQCGLTSSPDTSHKADESHRSVTPHFAFKRKSASKSGRLSVPIDRLSCDSSSFLNSSSEEGFYV